MTSRLNVRDPAQREVAARLVVSRYVAGMTAREAGEDVGVTTAFAAKVVKEAGVVRPHSETISETARKARQPFWPRIRELSAMNYTAARMADEIGRSVPFVYKCLADLNLPRPKTEDARKQAIARRAEQIRQERKKYHAEVRRLFDAGYPVLRISRTIGIGRAKVAACLQDMGLEPPNRSEGTRRGARLDPPEARVARAKAAHRATMRVGERPATRTDQAAQSAASLRYVGVGEREVAEYLEAQGLKPTPQAVVHGYNIDILVGSLAVEVHVSTGRPHRVTQRLCRIMELLSSGISVAYLWLPRRFNGQPERAALDEIVTFYNEVGTQPSALGEYRVIRGDGEIDFTSNREMDKFAAITARYAALKANR